MTTTYTAVFKDYTATRRTEGEYAFATRKAGKVVFHTTAEAARRRGGEMVKVFEHVGGRTMTRPETVKAVEMGAVTGCTIRTAIEGECGRPVVKTFVGTGGRVFGECARHVV